MKIKRESFFMKRLRLRLHSLQNFLDNNNQSEFHLNGESVFIEHFFRHFQKVRPVTVFDVGANVGSYTKEIASIAKQQSQECQIHAFEPVLSTFETLKKNLSELSGIHLKNAALSSKEGQLEIHYHEQGSPLASLYERDLGALSLSLDKKETISTMTGETYCEQNQVSHIHLLKIDVEGHEIEVLKGFGKFLNADNIDFIQFEYGGANFDSHTTLSSLYRFLESRGFVMTKIMKDGLCIRPFEFEMENFQYANYVAVSKRISIS